MEQGYKAERIAWIDIESTGFIDPHKGIVSHKNGGVPTGPYVLEVALVITDGDLNVLAEESLEVTNSIPTELRPPVLCDFAREMHRKNGLFDGGDWDEWAFDPSGKNSEKDASDQLCSVLERHRVGGAPFIWGGYSPGSLDRPVLAYYMPEFYASIDHWTIDVTSLKIAFSTWAGVEFEESDGEVAHRALPDTLHAIATVRKLREVGLIRSFGPISVAVSA